MGYPDKWIKQLAPVRVCSSHRGINKTSNIAEDVSSPGRGVGALPAPFFMMRQIAIFSE